MKHFGGEYIRLRGPMNSMLNAQSQRACDEAFEVIEEMLRSDPEKLQYVCDFSEHPERFAPFKINLIEGSLQRLGSVPPEQNHSSIVSHLGKGCAQKMEEQIRQLLTRQQEILSKKQTKRVRYENSSRVARKAAPLTPLVNMSIIGYGFL
jgi:hypothetical protein